MSRAVLCAFLASLAGACNGLDEYVPVAGASGASGGGAGGASAAGGAGGAGTPGGGGIAGSTGAAEQPNPLGRYRCKAPPGTTSSPHTIEQAVALLNALPKPTSVACFVESLARPLAIYATNSVFSAQPAYSTKSPRVFINTGDLWSSIVIDGEASELIEFGYLIPGTMRSIKGELHLPLTAPVAPSVPFERVLFGEAGTGCGLCHGEERLEPLNGIANAYSSIAFKPSADTHVRLVNLQYEAETCSWQSEPLRCELLSAVFGGGPVLEQPFPEPMVTFF